MTAVHPSKFKKYTPSYPDYGREEGAQIIKNLDNSKHFLMHSQNFKNHMFFYM
jgi:hypothetical protein